MMDLMFIMVAIETISDWFKPHENLAYYVVASVAFFALMFAVLTYFHKRRHEFV